MRCESAVEKINRDAAEAVATTATVSTTATAQRQAGPGTLDIEINGRRYMARWAQPGTVEHLRVNLRVEAGANGSTRLHVETLDLYSQRSRRVFATRTGRVFDADADAIEDELSTLLVRVDKAQRESGDVAHQPADDEPPEMSAAERRDALALLQRPDLIDQIARDIESIGYVGEETNKRLGYIIAVSRVGSNILSPRWRRVVPPGWVG